MKQMELLRDVGDDFERALFAAAEREPIPLSAKQEVARRLGLALPELSALGVAPSPASAGHAAQLGSAGPPAGAFACSRAGRSIWGKLTFLAAIVGLGWGGSLLGAAHTADGAAVNPSAVLAAPSREALAGADPAPELNRGTPESPGAESTSHATNEGATTALAVEEAPRLPSHPRHEARTSGIAGARRTASPKRGAVTSASRAAAADPGDGRLLREVRSLDAVRAALRAHDGARALERLDGYASEFPEGELALESQVLRVTALAQTEQRAAARSLALRTLAVPGSARYRSELEHSLHALDRPTRTE